MKNDQAEIRVDTRLVTDIKVSYNNPDIIVIDKKEGNSYSRGWNNQSGSNFIDRKLINLGNMIYL